MRIRNVFIVFLIICLLASCAQQDTIYISNDVSENDHQLDKKVNTPESLAIKSSQLYMMMVNGTIDVEDGIQEIIKITASASAKQLEEQHMEFASEINKTKQYMVSTNDKIIDYQYSKTEYTDDGVATIRRIQIHQNGKKYYFEQTFIQEDGEWKIKSDNLIDAFEL